MTTKTNGDELEPCPFCGGSAWLESNRDWHRIKCEHNGNCIIDEFEPMYAGHEQGRGWIIEDWNRRSKQEEASRNSLKVIMPEPRCRYADDSYKAYSRSQVEALLKELGVTIIEEDI